MPAPSPRAKTASEAANPELWDNAILMPLFDDDVTASVLGNPVTPSITTFAPEQTQIGQGYGQPGASQSGPKIEYQIPALASASALTFVMWLRPKFSSSSQTSGQSAFYFSENRAWFPIFRGAYRFTLGDSPEYPDIRSIYLFSPGDLIQYVYRLGPNSQTLQLYNATTDREYIDVINTGGNVASSNGNITLGNAISGGSSLAATMVYGYLQFARWTDQQVLDNRADAFNIWQRAETSVSLFIDTRGLIQTGASNSLGLLHAIETDAAIDTSASASIDSKTGVASESGIQTSALVSADSKTAIGSTADIRTKTEAPLSMTMGIQAKADISTSAQSVLAMLSRITSESAIATTGNAALSLEALFAIASRTHITTGATVSLALDTSINSRSDTQTTGTATVGLVSELESIAHIRTQSDLSLALRQLITARADIVTAGEWQSEIGKRLLYLVADGIYITPVLSADLSIDPLLDADSVDIKPH